MPLAEKGVRGKGRSLVPASARRDPERIGAPHEEKTYRRGVVSWNQFPWLLIAHSDRRQIRGSWRAARHAGMAHARLATGSRITSDRR